MANNNKVKQTVEGNEHEDDMTKTQESCEFFKIERQPIMHYYSTFVFGATRKKISKINACAWAKDAIIF